MTTKHIFIILLILVATNASAQLDSHSYKREINGVSGLWHKLELPDPVFSHTNKNLYDLRIYGLTASKDTLEVPYLLKVETDTREFEKVFYRTINRTRKNGNVYFTLMLKDNELLNHIDLDVDRSNFDWRLDIEGSHDQQEWFSISRNYRIVGISNQLTQYHFTRLVFNTVKYKYIRIIIKDTWYNAVKKTSAYRLKGKKGKYKLHEVKSLTQENRKTEKTSEVLIRLHQRVPVSELSLQVDDKIDFVRPISIEYLADSIQTEKGYLKQYRSCFNGFLSSFEEARFNFSNVYTDELRITVRNADNLPLKISGGEVKGNIHTITARFPEAEQYFLTYGKKGAAQPNYDLKFFEETIPENITEVTLGDEITIDRETKKQESETPDYYLWAVIVFVSVLLGFFAIKMMMHEKKNSEQ